VAAGSTRMISGSMLHPESKNENRTAAITAASLNAVELVFVSYAFPDPVLASLQLNRVPQNFNQQINCIFNIAIINHFRR
jgi:hypothetical protein